MMNISMVNAFVCLKIAEDDDQFKNELQYVMNSKLKLPCSEFAAWLLCNACWSFAIITMLYNFLNWFVDLKLDKI